MFIIDTAVKEETRWIADSRVEEERKKRRRIQGKVVEVEEEERARSGSYDAHDHSATTRVVTEDKGVVERAME